MSDNIVKKVCKELGITQKELAEIGSETMLVSFINFENSQNLEDAYTYLLTTRNLIEIAENEKLFPISLTNHQNKTKREIFYPNIKIDIINTIYTIENLSKFVNLLKTPIKQTDLVKKIKELNLNAEKIKNGLWFLSEYGFIKRWKEKNRIYLQLSDKFLNGVT